MRRCGIETGLTLQWVGRSVSTLLQECILRRLPGLNARRTAVRTAQPTVLLLREEFVSEGLGEADVPVWNNLIERLRTRLVDVQPPNKFRERSVVLEQNLASKGNAKRANGRADCPVRLLFAGSTLNCKRHA
jgi:hypothetical protein